MENKDPLFENIRKHAHNINQTPSNDAWTKLASRLDKHTLPVARRRKLAGWGILSVAASVLLLVSLVFIISQTVLKPERSMVMAEHQAIPRQIEDLPLLGSTKIPSSPQMAEYQRKINANPRGIIKEGGYHKKLVAQSINEQPVIRTEATHGNGVHQTKLSDFDWIIGEWIASNMNGTSTEIWHSVAPGRFVGTGSFINTDNQSIFTEKMALVERNNKIYFEAITQSAGEKVAYLLQGLENNRAIFHNKFIDFPTHVEIIRMASGGFIITFKNIPPVAIPNQNILLKNDRNTVKSKEIIRTMDRKI